uniref:Uncharacterized protein n=1 Tax=Piliocolobus tephrosceles TaxID=591936 RepID=A0A8C9H589_9PRIM
MFKAVSWTFRGLHCPSVPLSAKMFGKRADKGNVLTDKVAGRSHHSIPAPRIHFAIARHLAQDGAHMVVSGQKQQNVGWAVATLSMVGTMCHLGKAEDQEWLVKLGACNTSRTALLGLSKSLAMELAPKDIWVNSLCKMAQSAGCGWGRIRE